MPWIHPPDALTATSVLYMILMAAFPPHGGRWRRSALWAVLGWVSYISLRYWYGALHHAGSGSFIWTTLPWSMGWSGFVIFGTNSWRTWPFPLMFLVAPLLHASGVVPLQSALWLQAGMLALAGVVTPLVLLRPGRSSSSFVLLGSLYLLLVLHGWSWYSHAGTVFERLGIPIVFTVLWSMDSSALDSWEGVISFALRGLGGALFLTASFLGVWALSRSVEDFVGASVLVGLGAALVMTLWERVVVRLLEGILLRRSPLVRAMNELIGELGRYPGVERSILERLERMFSSLDRPQRWGILELSMGTAQVQGRDVTLPPPALWEELRNVRGMIISSSRNGSTMLREWMERSGLDVIAPLRSVPDPLLFVIGADPPLAGIEIDTTHRLVRSLTDALERSTRMREFQDRERLAMVGELAAGLAHEIRNPLAAMKGAAELLEEEGSNFASIIVEESARLNRVLSSFLEYARPFEISVTSCNLREIVERSIEAMSPSLRGIELQMVLPDDPVEVMVDPDRIHQVLMNLVTNAVQALEGRDGGRVIVRIMVQGDWAFVEVEDNGPGIPDDVLPKIFVPFFSTRKEGTGLGLALSHKLVALHGGTLEARSVPGRTIFRFSLPLHGG